MPRFLEEISSFFFKKKKYICAVCLRSPLCVQITATNPIRESETSTGTSATGTKGKAQFWRSTADERTFEVVVCAWMVLFVGVNY